MSELKISKKQEQEKLTVFIGGRIDTGTSARLGDEVRESLDGITDPVLDFGEVSYISSSGLRVILSLHKTMAAKSGRLTVSKPVQAVYDVFDVTGFAGMINIER